MRSGSQLGSLRQVHGHIFCLSQKSHLVVVVNQSLIKVKDEGVVSSMDGSCEAAELFTQAKSLIYLNQSFSSCSWWNKVGPHLICIDKVSYFTWVVHIWVLSSSNSRFLSLGGAGSCRLYRSCCWIFGKRLGSIWGWFSLDVVDLGSGAISRLRFKLELLPSVEVVDFIRESPREFCWPLEVAEGPDFRRVRLSWSDQRIAVCFRGSSRSLKKGQTRPWR